MRISIEEAAKRLKAGEAVAIPTETVYGLAASIGCPAAIAEIYALKGRPSNNPLIIHLASAGQISEYAKEVPSSFYPLADAFWPGPLTVVLPANLNSVPSEVRADLPTAAFRVPSHPMARAVIQRVGPIGMPSANLSGSPSSTSCEHVESDFGGGFPVLDGGECSHGVESTIIYWGTEEKVWKVLRQGALAPEDFKGVLGYVPEVVLAQKGEAKPLCPGQLYRHYAPKARLKFVNSIPKDALGVVVGFENRPYPIGCRLFSMGRTDAPEVAAQRLYAILRRLDVESISEAWVDADFPDTGLWRTLRERLTRACGG